MIDEDLCSAKWEVSNGPYSLRKMYYNTDVYSCFQVHGPDKSIDTGFYPPSPQDKIGLVYIKLKEIT